MLPTGYDELHADAMALGWSRAAEIVEDGRIDDAETPDALALLAAYEPRSFEAEWIVAQRRRAVQDLRRGPGEPCPDDRLARRLAELEQKCPRRAQSDESGE